MSKTLWFTAVFVHASNKDEPLAMELANSDPLRPEVLHTKKAAYLNKQNGAHCRPDCRVGSQDPFPLQWNRRSADSNADRCGHIKLAVDVQYPIHT